MEAVTGIRPVRREKRAFDAPPPAPAATKAEVPGREAQTLIEVTEQGYTRITNVFPT